MNAIINYIKRILSPPFISPKLQRFKDANSPDFLEKYYEELEKDPTNARE